MDNQTNTEKVYTVLELNNEVNYLLKDNFSEYVWVCGEIQDLRASRDRRHIYFSLVQKHPKLNQIEAKVNAAIFANRKPQIERRFKEANIDFDLKDDIEVKFLCDVSLYPKTGNFSIIIVDIDPIYTLGKVAQSRQKIIEELTKKGLLQKNKERVIPVVPLNIGLITSGDSAAYHDFTNELSNSGYGFKVSFFNSHMQGNQAEKDILKALNYFNSLEANKLDAVVITRGGGSTADLSYFDNKKIAESIAYSKFPVISALGHQINTTISDMVAHTFCKTPTKGAQFLVERVRDFVENLNTFEEQISKLSKELIIKEKKDLQTITMKLDSTILRYFRIHREELLDKKHNILNISKIALANENQNLKGKFDSLKALCINIFRHSKDNLSNFEGKIKILDPKNILKRGYSITLKDGKAIKSIDDINKGDIIKTLLYRGASVSRVEKKEKYDG